MNKIYIQKKVIEIPYKYKSPSIDGLLMIEK